MLYLREQGDMAYRNLYSAHVAQDYKRIVAYVDAITHENMRVALVLDGMSFSQWLRSQEETYVQARLRGWLTLVEPLKEG